MTLRIHPLLLALLSGALLACAYRLPGFWPLSFLALVPLIWAVEGSRTALVRFATGAIAGVVVMGVATCWFFSAIPLPSNFGLSNIPVEIVFVFICWFLVIMATGLVMGVWTLALRFLSLTRPLDIFAASLLWPALEFIRTLSFNLLTFAPGIHNPAFFTAGFIGFPLLDSESLGQFAALGGIYTLGFIAVTANMLVYAASLSGNRRRRIVSVVVLLVLAIISFMPIVALRERFSVVQPEKSVVVAVISIWTNTQESEEVREATAQAEERQFMHDASAAGARIIVLPEGARMLAPFTGHTAGEYLVPGSDAAVIDSGTVGVGSAREERSFSDTAAATVPGRDKLVLTPQGEYLTFLFRLFLEALGANAAAAHFDAWRGHTSFSTGTGTVDAGDAHAIVLFCLEAMDPGLAKGLASATGANLILLPASHSLFQPSRSLEADTLRFGRLQAIEAGLPLAASVREGSAYVLDRYGRISERVGADGVGGELVRTVSVAP